VAGYLGFGLYRTGAMSLNFFNMRVAQLFIGVLLGAQALGYYSVASSLVVQPVQKLTPVLTRVAFPVFSQVQDDMERLRRGYLQMVRLLMFLSGPSLIGAAAVAPTAVPLLLGEQWTEAVPLVQALAFYALFRSMGNASGSLILALGRADWGFYWNLAALLVIPPTVYLASLSGSVVYVAWSMVAVRPLLVLLYYRMLSRKLTGLRPALYVRAVGVPLLLAGAMGVIVLGTGAALGGLTDATRLGVQVSVGALSYLSLVWLFMREDLRTIVKMARSK
jgi:PST family polysaccharide transporter/teichuronic acid exporter/lipopolysaccharide exporter